MTTAISRSSGKSNLAGEAIVTSQPISRFLQAILPAAAGHARFFLKILKRHAVESINDNPTVEWTWIAGRLAIILAVLPGTWFFLSGTGADRPVYAAIGTVLIYNALLAWRLKATGNVKEVFVIGFGLDNIVTVAAWLGMAQALSGSGITTDLYLLLFTKLVIGSVRFSWLFASFYATFWITFATSVNYIFYGPESYDAQQAPLRVIFLAGTAVLAIRLVAKLNRERKTADLLRAESEAVAEIGSLVSSTLEFDETFPRFAHRMNELIPFDRLALASVTGPAEQVKLTYSFAESIQPWLTERALLVPQVMRESVFGEMRPMVFGEDECALIQTGPYGAVSPETASLRTDSGTSVATRALLMAPVVRKGEVVALLLAGSCKPGVFTDSHVELLAKIGAHIGGAIASAQLYQRTLQLTEERLVRERLDAENRELQRVNDAKSSLVAFVSHELRTPLTSIIAHKDILSRRREGFTERQMRSLNAIGGSAELLNDLISDLLDMSKIESGRLELSPEPVEVRPLMDGIRATFEPVLGARSQKLVINLAAEVDTVFADRRKLVQVLNNLVSNASKYSPEGRRVTCSVRLNGEDVLFEVADQGIGISEEDQRQLFTPFYRSPDPEARKQPGTGLGLVVSRGIVLGHGGEMTVSSMHGVGTTVSFTMPRRSHAMSVGSEAA